MEDHSPSNQNTLKIGIVVLLGALGLLGYLYYGSKNENSELQKVLSGKLDELSTTRIKLDSISNNLDEKIDSKKKKKAWLMFYVIFMEIPFFFNEILISNEFQRINICSRSKFIPNRT